MNAATPNNPYQAPVQDSPLPVATSSFSIKAVFIKWEKLRLVYNGLLIAETLLILLATGLIRFPLILFACVFGAVVANGCYLLGPIIDSYAHWLGYRGNMLAGALFTTGMIVAMLAVPVFLQDVEFSLKQVFP